MRHWAEGEGEGLSLGLWIPSPLYSQKGKREENIEALVNQR